MNETNSSSNIMSNDIDKSFYIEFKPKADSSWKPINIADTIIGFTESMMNLSVSEPKIKVEEKKVTWMESISDGVITVFDSDEEKEISKASSNEKQDMDISVQASVLRSDKIISQSYHWMRKEEPSKEEESLDRFKIGHANYMDSKDTFKAEDISIPETEFSSQSEDWKNFNITDDPMGLTLERYESAKQEAGESKSEYFARLRKLARKHFEEEVKRQILEEEKAKALIALKDLTHGSDYDKVEIRT